MWPAATACGQARPGQGTHALTGRGRRPRPAAEKKSGVLRVNVPLRGGGRVPGLWAPAAGQTGSSLPGRAEGRPHSVHSAGGGARRHRLSAVWSPTRCGPCKGGQLVGAARGQWPGVPRVWNTCVCRAAVRCLQAACGPGLPAGKLPASSPLPWMWGRGWPSRLRDGDIAVQAAGGGCSGRGRAAGLICCVRRWGAWAEHTAPTGAVRVQAPRLCASERQRLRLLSGCLDHPPLGTSSLRLRLPPRPVPQNQQGQGLSGEVSLCCFQGGYSRRATHPRHRPALFLPAWVSLH